MDAREQYEWRRKANKILQRDFGIELNDCTPDGKPPEAWYDEEPQAFVDHVAYKYDLNVLTREPW